MYHTKVRQVCRCVSHAIECVLLCMVGGGQRALGACTGLCVQHAVGRVLCACVCSGRAVSPNMSCKEHICPSMLLTLPTLSRFPGGTSSEEEALAKSSVSGHRVL